MSKMEKPNKPGKGKGKAKPDKGFVHKVEQNVAKQIVRDVSARAVSTMMTPAAKVKSIMKPKKNPFDYSLSRIQSLMRLICDPADAKLVRAGQNGAQTTAIRRVKTNATPSFNNTTKQLMVFLFRDPFKSAIMLVPTTGYTYTAVGKIAFLEQQQNLANSSFVVDLTKLGTEQHLDIKWFTYVTGDRVHGSQLFPVQVKGNREMFVFKNTLDQLNITSNMVGTGTITFIVYSLIDGNVTEFSRFTNTSSTSNTAVNTTTQAGYFAVSATVTVNTSLSSVNFTVSVVGGTGNTWAHTAAEGISAELSKMGDMRETATSLLLTNATPEIYKEGMITACQMSGSVNWLDLAAMADPFKFVSSQNGCLVPTTAVNGLYTYLRPININDFDFRKQVDINTVDINRAGSIADDDDSFIVAVVKVSTVANQVFNVVATDVYEYRSNSQQDAIEFSNMTITENQVAFDHLRTIPQYTENPTHIRDIWNAIKKVGIQVLHGLKTAAPYVIEGAKWISALAI